MRRWLPSLCQACRHRARAAGLDAGCSGGDEVEVATEVATLITEPAIERATMMTENSKAKTPIPIKSNEDFNSSADCSSASTSSTGMHDGSALSSTVTDSPRSAQLSEAPSASFAASHVGQRVTLVEADAKVSSAVKSDDFEALLEAANMLMELQEFGRAEAAFMQAVERHAQDIRAYQGAVAALQGQGRYLKAFSIAKRGVENLPGNKILEALQEQARLLYKAHKPSSEATGPQLTKEQAREVLSAAIDIFEKPSNYEMLKDVVQECHAAHADSIARSAAMSAKLLPLVTEMLGELLAKYGFDKSNVLNGMAMVQFHAIGDEEMQPKVQRIMNVLLMGKFE